MQKAIILLSAAALACAGLAACGAGGDGAGADAGADTDSDADSGADTDTGDDPPDEIGPPGRSNEIIVVDGVERAYTLYVPESAVDAMADGPVPLLFGFHGAGDTGSNFVAATGLEATADANAFVLVGPWGFNAGWFVEAGEGWPGDDGNDTSLQNDLQLVYDVISITRESYWVDGDMIYAVGHSRGAGFTGLAAMLSGGAEISSGAWVSPFAAYGINAGYDASGGSVDPAEAEPKRPVWIVHGTSDSVVPYSYGNALYEAFEAGGWDVTFTPVEGGGHTWLWRSTYGQTNQDLWDWFAANAIDP
ncbi:MAG: hypothetical protein M0R80_16260 [Proteobacteria bacterium]|jgi:poly(3-hydroxybutyrate) depolymerase|nr:hypothetical protein [Pseudomonadota bacterium]